MRRTSVAAFAILLVVYALTLAPDVTFWDAGEFVASAHSLGIPHPPGTPLFVLLLHAWASLLPIKYVVATNLFSATATALAGAITARIVQRATGSNAMAIAAAIAAGCMSSVWLNATETEVYAASLALGVITVWAGDRAGRDAGEGWTLLTAYCIALGVPLHLSALVAAPAAIVLAALTPAGINLRRALVLGGTLILAVGAGRVSLWMCAVGAVVAFASLALPYAVIPSDSEGSAVRRQHALPFAALAVALIAISGVAYLIVRAGFDPAINQGNPSTLQSLTDVIARRQYAVAPIWPRMAPAWMQIGNFLQYADWQTALSFEPLTGPASATLRDVFPAVLRTVGTVLFAGLGILGTIEHRERDERTWLGVLTLFVGGSLGVIVYLNLHAGPSFLYGFYNPDIGREARERDYFFVFAFWAWGVWSGIGAVSLMRRIARPAWAGVALAAVPTVLNWSAITRHRAPESVLPRLEAESLLESAPRNAALFVIGDNDTYPLWYAQQALGVRRDVALITIPLLPTRWYRAEIARRFGFLDADGVRKWDGTLAVAARVADGVRRRGRPVAAAITIAASERQKLGRRWLGGSFAYVECDSTCSGFRAAAAPADTSTTRIDARLARDWAERISQRLPRDDVRPAIDPINLYMRALLDCPRQLAHAAGRADFSALDSVCNYR